MTRRMNALRSPPWLASVRQADSGCCTTPISSPATISRRYSGRCGGTRSWRAGAMSTMGDDLLLLDAIGEQHVMDAVGQLAAVDRVGRVAAVAVELALDLPGVGREQKDAVADQH